MPSRLSSTHLPRFTGEVRVGLDVTVRTLAWVSDAQLGPVPASETRRNWSPTTPRMP